MIEILAGKYRTSGAILLAMEDVVREAKKIFTRRVNNWLRRYAPQATGALLQDMLASLPDIESNVSYAHFVNEMRGVNWTNPTTKPAYFDEAVKYASEIWPECIDTALEREGLR